MRIMKGASATTAIEAPKHWPDWLRRDFAEHQLNGCVGSTPLSETDRVRVWSIRLAPGKRLSFHRHVLNCFWTATTAGRARSYYHDGEMEDRTYTVGEIRHMSFGPGEFMMLENTGDTELIFTTVEFLDSANRPIAIPAAVRRSEAA
jgi:hypothetical protein